MRRIIFPSALCLALAMLLCLSLGVAAQPIDLDAIASDESPEQICDRVAADPFSGFGPEEWARPFDGIDHFRGEESCGEAVKAHPGEARYKLQLALAYLAAKQNTKAEPLLEPLIADNNSSAMLALAFISKPEPAAKLMRKAADAGSATGMMLFAMAELTGAGVAKDEVDAVRMMRSAADAGSTRAMLILANFYNGALYGLGYDPAAAKRLIAKAAELGDLSAKDMLAGLEQAPQE